MKWPAFVSTGVILLEEPGKRKKTEQYRFVKEADKAVYMTCDFGILQSKEPRAYEELLSCLMNGQREYVEGIPWRRQRCYFEVQDPMREILFRLCEKQQYEGSIYFYASKAKMNIVRY